MTDLDFVFNVLSAIKAAGAGIPSPLTRLKAIAGTAAANNASDVLLQCTYSNGDTRACRVTVPVPVKALHDGQTSYLGGLLVSEIGSGLPVLSRETFEHRFEAISQGASN
jgi:hypothetical protein